MNNTLLDTVAACSKDLMKFGFSVEEFANMMDQMMEAEGVTEELKGKDQMEWLRRVNNIRNRVDEVILNELVYV